MEGRASQNIKALMLRSPHALRLMGKCECLVGDVCHDFNERWRERSKEKESCIKTLRGFEKPEEWKLEHGRNIPERQSVRNGRDRRKIPKRLLGTSNCNSLQTLEHNFGFFPPNCKSND